ncbi:MAG TPA: glutamyl-tRNA reductase [Longimicrobiales bacterium]|nr:glutamyl-tRNA reductase [Longimicrobiales bacterium]
MAAELFVLGTSHSVAPACIRERMHIDLEEIVGGLRRLEEIPGLLDEAVPLVTCGRLEVYGLSQHPLRACRAMKDLLGTRTGMARDDLDAHSYTRWGEDAARHLFRVASGLDSVIYGEAQILGQVRDALADPATEDLSGTFMKRLFQSALAAGKRVRAETDIGRGSASVVGAALCLLEEEAGTFEGMTALILGAGETGALMARLLRKAGVSKVLVANRTIATAGRLASELGGESFGLDEYPGLLSRADIVVGAVTGRSNLVTADVVRAAVPEGSGRKYFLDLAHPRNLEPDLAQVPGIWLLDLAQIFGRAEGARQARAAQVPRAETIVEAEVENFVHWVRSRSSAPVLRAVREQILALAHDEAERRARGKSPEEREELARFARSLARTLLHAPTVAIREADPGTPEGQWLLRAAPALFGLDDQGAGVAGGAG